MKDSVLLIALQEIGVKIQNKTEKAINGPQNIMIRLNRTNEKQLESREKC